MHQDELGVGDCQKKGTITGAVGTMIFTSKMNIVSIIYYLLYATQSTSAFTDPDDDDVMTASKIKHQC